MNFVKDLVAKPSHKVHLKHWKTHHTGHFTKELAAERLEKNTDRLFELQYLLYAENQRSVLVVLQGMDSSGKDGVIRHVARGLNPQGCSVYSFKAPTSEELEHDYLWRIHQRMPAKGDITIFNRSHYEDVLIVRVKDLVPKDVWRRRYDEINQFEKYMTDNGTTILKFFLHISKDEQRDRLMARIENPKKNWKFNEGDIKERALWKGYQEAYEEVLERCSTPWAPWYVIPADKKWFRNLAVSEILNHQMEKMNLKLPKAQLNLKKLEIA